MAMDTELGHYRYLIESAFDAGCAFTIGSHGIFKQIHPDKSAYVEKAMKTLMVGSPRENKMHYCPTCDKKLAEISFTYTED